MVILLLILSNGMLFAQFTRQQAIHKVLNEIVVADTGNINVYSAYDLLTNNDSIVLAFDTTLVCPYNYNWFFYIDDYPIANWSHPCRYIFIDTVSGNYQIMNQHQFPASFRDSVSNMYELVAEIPSYPIVQLPPNQGVNMPTAVPNPNLFAVLIITEDGSDHNPSYTRNRFWFDASLIYNTLINVYGFTEENIIVHYGALGIGDQQYYYYGDFLNPKEVPYINCIDFPASKASITQTFNNLSGKNVDPNLGIPTLTEEQQLFVFIDGHGDNKNGNSTIILELPDNTSDFFYDYELADLVEDINCAQMTFLIQPCNSGHFATELTDYNSYNAECENRVVHTSTTLELSSSSEAYLTQNQYCEYTFYWAAAANGNYPVFEEPWQPSTYESGSFPFDILYPFDDHDAFPDFDPDVNGDDFVQMEEAFSYADHFDSKSTDGYCHYPLDPRYLEIPQNQNKMVVENLTTLKGLAGFVENDNYTAQNRHYVVGDKITIKDDGTLTIYENSTIHSLVDDAKFQIDIGGELATEINTIISGGEITADGLLFVDDYTTFNNCDISINGIEDVDIRDHVVFNDLSFDLNNSGLNTDLSKATFNQCILTNYGQSLNIDNSVFNNNVTNMQPKFFNYGLTLNISNTDFNNCYMLYSQMGNINVINGSSFLNTWLYLENTDIHNSTAYVNINNSSFVKSNYPFTIAGIDISHYGNYSITNNTFNGLYNGIQLGYSGESVVSNQLISDNEFTNCTMAGLLSYESRAKIENNHIHNNNYGINIGNNSSTDLSGNPNAQNAEDTQRIIDNDSYELNIMDGSFPWNMHYNVIIDEDNLGNPSDPMIYFSEYNPNGSLLKDVRYNCWGSNFSPNDDFYPTGYYYTPTWCPNQLKSSLVVDSAETLYLSAREHFIDEDYSTAKSTYKSVIYQYSVTKYAGAAMKDLFTLEAFDLNDYNALKQYYLTDTVIQADTVLQDLSSFLANKCDIKLENWQTAIDHYEDIIENPETIEDSICAIIDLGDLYFIMANNSNRENAQGKLLEHKPSNKANYLSKRNFLLSLLPVKEKTNKEKEESDITYNTVLYQNKPNPFSGNTSIEFNIPEKGEVAINVFDITGKMVNETLFVKPAGVHKYNLNLGNLPSGIYFYSLSVNGLQIDIKKMIKLK